MIRESNLAVQLPLVSGVKIAAAVLALAALAWASWPNLEEFPEMAPEDAEALRLVRDLERGRAGALEAILQARNPRTVPALMALRSPPSFALILHPSETRIVDGVAFPLPRNVFCCEDGERPHPPVDAFESASQAALQEGDVWAELIQRGCTRCVWSGDYELERRLGDPEPGVRFAAAFRVWRAGHPRLVPRALGTLGEHAFARYAWLEPVAEVMRRETSEAAIRDGARKASTRALAAAAFLKLKPAVEEIARGLNDSALKASWPDLAWTLGEIGDARAVEPLVRALKRGEFWLTGDAAEALAKIAARSALPALREALDEAEVYGQAAILRALGIMGEAEDIPRVECYATSEEYTGAIGRRRAAQDALRKLRP